MYVVAVTRWAQPLEQEVAVLAPLLSLAPYDLKLRLAGPVPAVFARERDPGRARELLAALRERGHGAVGCELERVASSADMASARSYRLEPDELVAVDPERGERAMAYAEMVGLIHARATTIEQSEAVTKKKSFSFGRAALTGGLVMRKTTTSEQRSTSETSEQVLYVIRQSGHDPILLREQQLRHQGLGSQVRPTSLENFATLVELLRAQAPAALYDDRLLHRSRKTDLSGLSGTSANKLTELSNASETDLAVHLIVVAHLTGQL